jgi:hypothetical protein
MNDSRLRRDTPERRRPVFFLTAEFDRANGQCAYTLIPPTENPYPHLAKFSLTELRACAERLRDALESYVFSDHSRSALRKLAEAGADAFRLAMTDINGDRLRARQTRLGITRMLMKHRNAIVAYTSNTGVLPLDLFYLEDPKKVLSPQHFLGMRHVVTRAVPTRVDSGVDHNFLRCSDRLQVGIACDTSLTGAVAEKKALKKMKGDFHIKEIKHTTENDFIAGWKERGHGIVHCSCHGERTTKPPGHWLKFEDTQTHIEAASLEDEDVKKRLPFVFLNACESGEHLLSDHHSFAGRILGVCGSAMMVTECAVADRIADAFSRAFYGFFFKGSTASEALSLARQTLNSAGHGVSGLAYSLHSAPLFRITYEKKPR